MYRTFLALFLLGVFLLIFYVFYRKHKDIFHPLCFFSILSILRYVPSIFSAETDNFVRLTEDGLTRFVLLTSLYTVCVISGYYLFSRMNNKSVAHILQGELNNKMFSLGLGLFFVGTLSRIYFIYSSGGLLYILSNIQNKVEMVTGNGYLLAIGNFMTYGIVLMMCSDFYKQRRNLVINLLLLICIGSSFFLFAFMSDRTAPMRFLMIVIMAYHYNFNQIKVGSLLKPKSIALIISLVVFIVAMPLLRNKDGYDKYGSVSNLMEHATDEIGNIFYWFSYTGRDVFIYEHFDMSNYWGGKNLLNFISAPIPASLLKDKPPVDEGYYLANLIKGHESSPPETRFSYKSSIPFDNQGIMYANFGILGLILGGIIVGVVYGYTYKLLITNDYHPLVIVISQIILYNFSLTSHDMVNVILLIGFMLLPLIVTKILSFNRIMIESN